MRPDRAVLAASGVLALAQAGAARAADPPAANAHTVSEVVVTAIKSVSELVVTAPIKCPRVSGELDLDSPRGPAVVSSFPAKGQAVRPGLVVMRVTFDRPVACAGGFSDDPPLAYPCPDQLLHMVLSYDRRTVRTVCLLDPDKVYGVQLNRASDGDVFRTVDGAVGPAFTLRFSTTLATPVTDVCEALREDVEMLAAVEKAHPLDCAARDDPQAAMVKATVELRDAAARAARDQAIAQARALRERQAAAELARAETLALAAYRKARDRSWAATRRAGARGRGDPPDERLVTGPDIRNPTSQVVRVLSPGAAEAAAARAPQLAQPARPPELPNWRQAFVVGATNYDCGVKDGAVSCERR